MAPASPAVFVFIIVSATASALSLLDIEPTLPPLNPNQPIQSINAPSVTSGILLAGITLILPFLYLPLLAPTIKIAASRAQAPVEWITVEPAKSCIAEISKIVSLKKLLPQVQFTTIG